MVVIAEAIWDHPARAQSFQLLAQEMHRPVI